jgi:flagellar assembly protein FliH
MASQPPRKPSFLGHSGSGKPVALSFRRLDEARPSLGVAWGAGAEAEAGSPPMLSVAVAEPEPPPALPPAPPPPPAPPSGLAEGSRALAMALEQLTLESEHLAQQSRSDALELGFLVAKKILEMEVSASPAALFALIRSAVRKVGDARTLTVRLHPEDCRRLEAAGGVRQMDELSMMTVEVRPDSSLALGDCVIDSELGRVDGRLSTRLAEMKRQLEGTLGAEEATS